MRRVSMARSAAGKSSDAPQSFEAALAELERIVAGMEGGDLSLEQSLASYRRGAELLRYCQTQLAAAQQELNILEDGALREFRLSAESSEP